MIQMLRYGVQRHNVVYFIVPTSIRHTRSWDIQSSETCLNALRKTLRGCYDLTSLKKVPFAAHFIIRFVQQQQKHRKYNHRAAQKAMVHVNVDTYNFSLFLRYIKTRLWISNGLAKRVNSTNSRAYGINRASVMFRSKASSWRFKRWSKPWQILFPISWTSQRFKNFYSQPDRQPASICVNKHCHRSLAITLCSKLFNLVAHCSVKSCMNEGLALEKSLQK